MSTMPESSENQNINAAIGTTLILAGGLLACLVFADRWTELNLPLPHFWYTSRNFHVPLCVLLFIGAWLTLRQASEPIADENAEPLFDSVVIYSRSDCPLCDEAKAVLEEFPELPAATLVNIDNDNELLQMFSDSIPVVAIDGREMFRGHVRRELLKRLIAAKQTQQLNRFLDDEAGQGG